MASAIINGIVVTGTPQEISSLIKIHTTTISTVTSLGIKNKTYEAGV